jgi:ACS family glucarate transporter-like MFS transporter
MNESALPRTTSGDRTLDSRATGARWLLLGWLCSLALLLYVDRVCIGQAEKAIREELGLNKEQMSWVFGAFTLAYCLFEVPTGYWGDRFGSRRVITRVVLWWTAFTAMTGLAWNVWSLVILRFLFGAGEAGALPNVARIITRWYPVVERGRVRGAVMTISFLGAAIAPIICAALIYWVGWRVMFLTLGVIGIFWAWGFYSWFRDDPASHPAVNAAELTRIRGGSSENPIAAEHTTRLSHGLSWLRVLTSANTWLMGTIMTVVSVLFYTVFQWFPTYLKEARQASEMVSGLFTSVVMAAGACGCIVGGWVVDAWNRSSFPRLWARRLHGSIALFGAAVSLWQLSRAESQVHAVAFCAAALFCAESAIANWWTVVAEISGRYGAALWGLMNSMGGFGVMLATLAIGQFVDAYEKAETPPVVVWNWVFGYVAAVLAFGSVCWLLVNVTKPIAEGSAEECP